MIRTLLVCSLLASVPVVAAPRLHVRVVLDLSISMRTNDPARMAVLSTALLHDLAQPNSTLGDTFEVIPFDADWNWSDPSAAPPVSSHPRLTARIDQRADFLRRLGALSYDAKMTYFYPGLRAGLEDLERIDSGAHDIRTIVLVTDGVPEEPTRDAELQRIRDELAPRFERHGIRLYVLAFGAEADNNRGFFDSLVRSASGSAFGEYLVDPQGDQLLAYMLQIFSKSFGYSPDAARALPGTSTVDLEAGQTPERVAVTILSSRPAPPRLSLTAPPGASVNAPVGVQSAGERGGSYSLLWVLSPGAGAYALDSDAVTGSLAVLRPTRLALEVRPGKGLKSSERALAGMPLPLIIRARAASGARGDPGHVDVSFRTFGERVGTTGAAEPYAWQSDRGAPPPGAGIGGPEGRDYDILAEFPPNPADPAQPYVGYLEVEARRGDAVVGALTSARAHRVEVHPMLALSPFPAVAYASKSALERRQRACTEFTLNLDAGRLPHPDKPIHPLRAVLLPRDAAVLDRELRQATFTLDGDPLQIEGRHGAQPGAWYKARPLRSTELLGKHEICVQLGKPADGDPARPVELSLAMTLAETPYDDFDVVKPFTLRLRVAPPTFLDRWRHLLLLALAGLAVAAVLWYSRDRPQLPNDLRYALAREGSESFASQELPEQSFLARLLGMSMERAVFAPGDDRPLGRIRPAGEKLYTFRPARGIRVETEGGDPVPLERGLATLSVHENYRVRSERGAYLFRIEYR